MHIFNQDVLLATSVLCLYLQDVDRFEAPEIVERTSWSPRADEIRQQLTIARKIWLQLSDASAEGGKVARALSIVLGSTETSTEDDGGSISYDLPLGFDDMPLNEFGISSNPQCEKSLKLNRSKLTMRFRFYFWISISSYVL